MNQRGFVKDLVIVVLGIAVLVVGYLYLSGKPTNAPAGDSNGVAIGKGVIEGSLSYPSDFIPPMRVCAEDINTKEQYCTTEHIKDSKYIYGQ